MRWVDVAASLKGCVTEVAMLMMLYFFVREANGVRSFLVRLLLEKGMDVVELEIQLGVQLDHFKRQGQQTFCL